MTPRLIDEADLQRLLDPLGFACVYREQTQSTNADVLDYFNNHQCAVVAVSESQSAGRGRRGREWLSPFARNIYCTVGIIKPIDRAQQGLLSIVTGVALCRVLREILRKDITLKWPNDLLFRKSKLGGILIEARPVDNAGFFFAVGFGLNVFMDQQELSGIPQAATSLQLISSAVLDRSAILIRCIEAVINDIQHFEPGMIDKLLSDFEHYDAYRGQAVELITAEGSLNGVNRGINKEGQLLLQTGEGIEAYSSAEISLKAVAI